MAVILGAATLGLAACGGDDNEKFDREDFLKTLESAYVERVQVIPQSVSCPDDLQPEAGKQVKCEAVLLDQTKVGLEVRFLNDEGGFQLEEAERTTKR